LDRTAGKSITAARVPFVAFASLVLVAIPLWAGGCTVQGRAARPSIVLVTIDTLRPDHLEAYGGPRATSPRIAELARWGVRFDYALSQASWTLPAMTSLLTSLYPIEHGAISASRKVDPSVVTLAEALRWEGYHTIGVVSHLFVSRRYGFDKGFDEFDESQVLGPHAVTSAELSRIALERMARAPRPFFLWVHYFDPHFSYVRHPEYGFADGYTGELANPVTSTELTTALLAGRVTPRDTRFVADVYDEEIAFTDSQVSRLLDGVAEEVAREPVVTILTADHGEYFMERGRFFHAHDVYDELVHVPLIIAGAVPPALRGTVVAEPVETRSVARTVMALVGGEHAFAGRNLLEIAAGGHSPPFVFAEGSDIWTEGGGQRAVVGGDWKLVERLEDGGYELYDRATDPAEREDRYGDDDPAVRAAQSGLRRALDGFEERKQRRASRLQLSDEEARRLRALGYLR
jgi:arylsulfatase A-like enzyme